MRQRPPVVLLCGGLGLRLRSESEERPKPLRPLPDGRALLLHIIDYYRTFGVEEFILCLGYGADEIKKVVLDAFAVPVVADATREKSPRLVFVESEADAPKSVRLLEARPHIGDRHFLLGYADVLSDLDLDRLLRTHLSSDAMVTLAATRVHSRFGQLTIGPRGAVTRFEEKPLLPGHVSAGYFVCAPDFLDRVGTRDDLERDTIVLLASAGEVSAVEHDGLWLPFDTYKDFSEAEEFISRKGYPWLMAA
ncbi:NTP transferase domain-containing protein [Nocardiopsis sp. HNM0947]|uniref:NTP transferase domain-containing protein n=1 Tax=Nocardiopsis coralli TaxID=2772213 RepID=A0ABR9P051_9ACTN|nr:sugar phosphate nucleotidyltransferase [Nocardiopsis coralli]MBE2997220.1 NTP transferase domain-containing protein [Nocardiopsis coralli]